MSRSSMGRAALACVVSLLVLARADDVSAAPRKAPPSLASSFTGEAKQVYEQARALFQHGDYAEALEALERTQRLSPDPRLFWNIAACEKKLGRHAKAINDVERYLSASASLLTDDDKREAEQFLVAARAYVSFITITGNVDGIEIAIDGELSATTPLVKPLVLDEGEHRVRFTRATYRTVERVEKVQGGSEQRWVVQLEPESATAVAPVGTSPPALREPAPTPRSVASPSRLGPLLVGGAGVVVSGLGGVLVGLTLSEASKLEGECGTACPPSRTDRYRALQTTGDVLLIVGGVAVAAGVTWWLLQPRAGASSGPRARVAPSWGGVVLEGSL